MLRLDNKMGSKMVGALRHAVLLQRMMVLKGDFNHKTQTNQENGSTVSRRDYDNILRFREIFSVILFLEVCCKIKRFSREY